VVAAVVGVLAGWPVDVGDVSLGQERALVGNLIAFVFALRTAVRLTFQERVVLTPTVRELSFRAERRFRFVAGQYLELEVPHLAPMRAARGGSSASSRRRRSCRGAHRAARRIAVQLQEGARARRAGPAARGDRRVGRLRPAARASAPVLMVAAGIGVTPFVSQLRHLRLSGSSVTWCSSTSPRMPKSSRFATSSNTPAFR
jgi:ferredoxin-NADP reductase